MPQLEPELRSTTPTTPPPPAITVNGFSEENPQFTLYAHHTGPNGFKVAEVLSELSLTYRFVSLEFGSGKNGMKTPEYQKINPNGRIPAIVDHGNNDVTIWESGAIILYLVKKYDTPSYRLWAENVEDQSEIETWLFYQTSGQGPYIGQAMWFLHYHSEIVPSAQDRYIAETRRVLGIVQQQLLRPGSNGWLVLGRITVADISFMHWYLHAHRVGVIIKDEYPAVWAWVSKMKERPGIKRGMKGARFPDGEGGEWKTT